eukprot:146552_1
MATHIYCVLLLLVLLCPSDCFQFKKVMLNWCTDLYIHPHISINNSKFGGRGVFTTNDILNIGTILLSIPIHCCIFEATIHKHHINTLSISHNRFDALFAKQNDVSIALYLTQLKLLKQHNHYFFPYLDQLPLAPSIPLFWKSNLMGLIHHTQAYHHTVDQYKHSIQVLKQFDLYDVIKPFHPQLFWAFSMVSSRLWNIHIKQPFITPNNIDLNSHQTSFGALPVLVPVADMFNHHPRQAKVLLKYNSTTETVNVISTDSIHTNEEIFIHYGPKSNSILLSQYGFILDHNPYAYSEFDLHLVKEDYNFGFKRVLMNQFDFTTLKFSSKGLDWRSAKAFFIAGLPPNLFDAHLVGKIMAVAHNSYWKSKIKEVKHTKHNESIDITRRKEVWLSQIEDDEMKKISSKLNALNIVNIETVLRQSLCDRFSMLLYTIEMQIKDGYQYNQTVCSSQGDCHTLQMIISYLTLEMNTLNACKELYCIDSSH